MQNDNANQTQIFRERVIADLATIKEQNEGQNKRLNTIEKTLNGNGQPGLVARVATLENNWKWAKWVAGAIGALASIAVNVIGKLCN